VAENAWLAGVVGLAGVVAIILTALVIMSVRPSRARTTDRTRPGSSRAPDATPGAAGRARLRLGAIGRPRRHRSVEGNFERAFARIDAVDPYAVQRRIGEALADAGLVSSASVFDDPPLPEHQRRRGEVTGRGRQWEDEP
jgi:hypothetical protein